MDEKTIIEIAKVLDAHKDALNFYLYMKALEPVFILLIFALLGLFFYKLIKPLIWKGN